VNTSIIFGSAFSGSLLEATHSAAFSAALFSR